MYFDYAAATPVDKKVLTAMSPYFSDQFYNPSSAYSPARQVRADYQAAKHRIAQVIGAKPAEIIITSGATESINLALAQCHSGLDPESGVITTAIEHPAVLETARQNGARILPVDSKGRVDPENLEKYITDDIKIVSIGYANNELGVVQNLKAVAEICRQKRLERVESGVAMPLVLHTDASQAAGLLDINVARLGVDLMTLSSGKCYGPKGVGLLYVRAGVVLDPLFNGGGQEAGLRSGTENVAGVMGFATALEMAEKKRKNEVRRLEGLQRNLEKYIISDIKNAELHSISKQKLPNIINFSVEGLDAERAVFALDQRGVQVSTGSACAANKGTRSHVLTAIGLSPAAADGSLRISLGRGTTKKEIEEFKPILKEIIDHEQKLS
ncbi:MAG: cysteine desulfurase [Candidatus Nomurabacteria bacterium]|jgi:cysteine desulfurase|nr:cysteine desulfurase [Candidatus Nomurabacteria bacterium]